MIDRTAISEELETLADDIAAVRRSVRLLGMALQGAVALNEDDLSALAYQAFNVTRSAEALDERWATIWDMWTGRRLDSKEVA